MPVTERQLCRDKAGLQQSVQSAAEDMEDMTVWILMLQVLTMVPMYRYGTA